MSHARDAIDYQQPPAPIPAILDAAEPPGLSVSPDGRLALESLRRTLPPVGELAVPAVETAGLRIHPLRGSAMDTPFTIALSVLELESGARRPLALPGETLLHDLLWSPDSRRLAWCRATDEGTELWVTELDSGQSRRLGAGLRLAAAATRPLQWLPDGQGLLALRIPEDRGAAPRPGPPTGPVVLENRGQAAPGRTIPFLIRDELGELQLEHHATAQLVEVGLDGSLRPLGEPAVVTDFNVSPDGRLVLVETARRPWSHSLPLWSFPHTIDVLDRAGALVHRVAELPAAEEVSIRFGSVRPGPRQVHWRADQPATLCWVEALDGGDAGRAAEERDALWLQDAPFTEPARQLARLKDRFAGLVWGADDTAILWESWHTDRRQRIWRLTPSSGALDLLVERSSEDAYSEPGWPLTRRDGRGRTVLRTTPDGAWSWWAGRGASPGGVHPFLDRVRLADGKRERVWECRDPWYESVEALLDDEGRRLLVSRQSPDEPETVWLLDRPTGRKPRGTADHRARRLTTTEDPAPMLAGLQKDVLTYRRADGVELSATLYLPPGYRRGVDPPLPAILWAYPREFKSREAAGRVTTSEFTFSRPRGTSILFLLTQGYAVLADPTLPIIAEEGGESNDRYLEQLEAGARAAVEELARLGVADTSRLAIGGHSYGAFTAANLLAHTDLFRTALCLSGAYNRTLTPFGFQGEDRSLWQAPETYLRMSPFLAADRIKRPVLLIHGMEDPNTGTFPMQSDRFFDALKGLGAEVRLVRLPAEGHGYRARESVGHVLWELTTWCDRHLKGVEPTMPAGGTGM
jgi:dipeptidyl aminopeptidase/acylaminoacyl peptidase